MKLKEQPKIIKRAIAERLQERKDKEAQHIVCKKHLTSLTEGLVASPNKGAYGISPQMGI